MNWGSRSATPSTHPPARAAHAGAHLAPFHVPGGYRHPQDAVQRRHAADRGLRAHRLQSGDAEALYRSIHEKVFSLPDETLIYPGHDYEGRWVTTVAQEKARNLRLGQGKSLQEFVAIMDGLDLPYPRKIDFAVPGNLQCGLCPPNVPEEYRAPCEQHDQG